MKSQLVFFVSMAALWAQTDQARFTGTVSDASGAVLAGAQVKVTNQRTSQERTVVSSAEGVFFVTGLLPSIYKVEGSAPGFSPSVFEDIELGIGQVRTLNMSLQAAGVTTEVTVSSGGLAEVETSSARMGVNVSSREVKELPLNGRQISQLYLLAPGAQTEGVARTTIFASAAGQTSRMRSDSMASRVPVSSTPRPATSMGNPLPRSAYKLPWKPFRNFGWNRAITRPSMALALPARSASLQKAAATTCTEVSLITFATTLSTRETFSMERKEARCG